MKLLLVHLSDLHIDEDASELTTRIPRIVDVVKNMDREVSAVAIAVTGDITFSGTDEQFILAWEFFENLMQVLSKAVSVPVHCIPIPGNHDCDLSDGGAARGIIISQLQSDKELKLEKDLIDLCTYPQNQFFSFLNSITQKENRGNNFEDKLRWDYVISDQTDSIRFICLNTAWMSLIPEQASKLRFPLDVIPEESRNESISICMFHHPYNWLEPDNSRKFRKRIESLSDIILTGHEHDITRRTNSSEDDIHNTYVEGGAFQTHGGTSSSEFNAFVIDTDNKLQKFSPVVWDGNKYSFKRKDIEGNCGMGLSWESLPMNMHRDRGHFTPNEQTLKIIDDMGVTLVQQNETLVKLSEIFIFPDLKEVTYKSNTPSNVIRGNKAYSFVKDTQHLLITGDTQSGKTALARRLFSKLSNEGYIPLLLNGSDNIPKGERFFGFIEEKFCEQYNRKSLELFQQCDRAKIVIIFDDYHQLKHKPSEKAITLDNLRKYAGKTILLAHGLALALQDITTSKGAGGESSYLHFRILPFNRVRRNRLVEQWLLLRDDNISEQSYEFAHALAQVNTLIDGVIGKNFVPSYPI